VNLRGFDHHNSSTKSVQQLLQNRWVGRISKKSVAISQGYGSMRPSMTDKLFTGWDLVMGVTSCTLLAGFILAFVFDWVYYTRNIEEMAERMKRMMDLEDEE